ncbi:MAG: DMT family transporter [Deltaproteobacteria bacterium]|nr:DMT family transporter [Deltaproteobacteria bacterium]MBW2594366.1 DMT family transporter [Deltaproteobacteria bacterium]MBW2649859.1 DMT family transporter [Deltaproteobacteria bacterium]
MAILWGGTFIAARVVAQNVDPFSASFLRFAIASIFLVFITIKLEGRIPRLKKHQILPVILLGMTGVFAYNFFFFSGLKTVAASRGSIIVATNPIFIALFAYTFFKEKLTGINVLGILLCVSGAIIVISKGSPLGIIQGGLGEGELYILGCVASWVLYSLIGKSAMKDMSPLVAVTYSCLVGGILLFFPACMEGMPGDIAKYSAVDWSGIFYLGFFGSVLGFTWYYQGIKKIGAAKASVFINFVPVSAVILACLILKEKLDLSLITGAIMVIGGAYLTNRK